MYPSKVRSSIGQYSPGTSDVNLKALPIGENGSQVPTAMTQIVVTMTGQLAQLCRNGIRFVRMMWIIRVCVSSDSTNQPVWNRALFVPAAEHSIAS